MITYSHDRTIFHDLDPRSKLLAQAGFAIAVFTQTDPVILGTFTIVALGILQAGGLGPVQVLRAYWIVLVILGMAPFFAMLTVGSPWVVPERGLASVLAGYQVILVLFVSAAYVRTTPLRETRAAIQRHVPGKLGQLLGVGITLTFRFFPVMLRDLRTAKDAIEVRSGNGISVIHRLRLIAFVGIRRAMERAQTLSLALRARCFAWNPTLPALAFSWRDYPVIGFALLLGISPLLF